MVASEALPSFRILWRWRFCSVCILHRLKGELPIEQEAKYSELEVVETSLQSDGEWWYL